MKKVILFAICLWNIVAFAQDEVSLVVSADGATKTQAIDNALRSAIEQTYGTFVSANTQILNDELVKDEIATVSSGNIQKYTEIATVTLPNGNTSVTLNVTVSLNKLVSYAQSKGSECEFAGAIFGANLRLYEFNKKNERIAIENMIKQLDALRPFYDYKLVMNDPVLNKDGRTARVSFTVEAINNDKTEMAYKIIENTFNSLALTQEQIAPLLNTGFSFQKYWLYFGEWKTGLKENNGRFRYLYNEIPGEICDYMMSAFCDFIISDNSGGIFFCDILPNCQKVCFGNHIEACYKSNRYYFCDNISTTLFDINHGYIDIDFLHHRIHGHSGCLGIVLFTKGYTLVSKEINCDVPIEEMSKINKVSIEPSTANDGTRISTGHTTKTLGCSYLPHIK